MQKKAEDHKHFYLATILLDDHLPVSIVLLNKVYLGSICLETHGIIGICEHNQPSEAGKLD